MKNYMSKKYSAICLFLVIIMVFSAVLPLRTAKASSDFNVDVLGSLPSSSLNVLIYQPKINFTNVNYPIATPPTPSALQGILKGFVASAATRAVQEITCLLIAEDIPYLSKALVALQDPATRAELQHKQLVKEMAQSVAKIEASVARIEDQLSGISNQIDNYATAEALRDAIQALNEIITKYQALWGNYEAVLTSGEKLSQLEALYPEETRTDEQKLYVSSAKAEFDLAVSMFLNAVEEGGGFPFLSDLEKLPGYIWNPADSTSDYDVSYLGAYEAYLRERYPFEHQITEHLSQAFEMSIDIQTQMLVLYREYYTYKQSLDKDNEELKVYTNEYFAKIQYGLINNIAAMAQSTGFESYIRPRAFTQEELEEIKKIDSTFVEGENVFSQITISGETYDAYKIRDNKTKEYFKIISNPISINNLITKIYSDSTNKIDLGKDIYRPSFFFNGRYSDDGLYQLTYSPDQLNFAKGQTNLLAFLRDKNGCNLENLSQTFTHVLFYSESFVPENLDDAYWNIPALSLSDGTIDEKSTKALYSSSVVPMLIYKDTFSTTVFDKEGVLTLNDKGLVENGTFVISKGEVLNLSEISLDISNVTIILRNGGKIISNPKIKLIDSAIYVCDTKHGDTVYIKDLNVVAKDKSSAALTIKSSCTVALEGENSFVGKSSKAERADVYKHYNHDYPTFASHGILIQGKNSIVTLAGIKDGYISYSPLQKVKAIGEGGGAGICHAGMNLTVKCLDLTAEGSENYVSSELTESGEQVYSIGAGIGSSISCILKTAGSFNVQGDEKIVSFGDGGINGTNYISIDNSCVSSKGVQSTRKVMTSVLKDEIYSEDIGGIKIDGGGYYCAKAGAISDSTIVLKNDSVSSRIITKGNNVYQPETYKITTYTKGSNGVTTDGVYFKLIGEKGETDWMLANGCGNSKGNWSGTVKGVSVGKIIKVEVKTKSSNNWYPGIITVTAQLCGESITVWGGRWIGNSGTALLPTDNVYEVTVKTGSDSKSGTDSGIYLTLKDNNNIETSQVYLSDIHQDSNAFEKGDSDTFPIYAPDGFGECTNARFYSDYKNSAAGWLLESFTVNKVQGGSDGFSFSSSQWFEQAGTINFGKYSGQTGSFYLEIKTADKSGAGTDSDIWLTIHGTEGSTGEIELDTYAGSGNNFEKNDLDCFHIGCDAYIGKIEKITIRKNDAGSGSDWKLDYIEITEKISNDKTPQSVRFNIDRTISDFTYDFVSPEPIVKSAQMIDREILNNLTQNPDGSYTVSVNRTVSIPAEAFELLKEKGIALTVKMQSNDQTIYQVFFDGSKITDYTSLTLSKGYAFADGNAMIDFLSSASLPEGTKVMINVEALGFDKNDTIVVLQKDENGWNESLSIENSEGFIEISTEEGKEILINKKGASIPDSDIPKPGDEGIGTFAFLSMISFALLLLIFKKSKTRA